MLAKFLVVTVVLLVFSHVVFRRIVRNDYFKRHRLTPLSYMLELVVFTVHANTIYLFIPLRYPNFPDTPGGMVLDILTVTVFSLGLIILLVAWIGLGSGTSFGQDKDNLKTGGIYKYSRNPQLVGYGILLISVLILNFSWYSIGWYIQYLVISYYMIQSEEEFLSRKYGEAYTRYCKEVPRLVKLG